MVKRVFAAELATYIDRDVTVQGWARFVRNTKSTTFIVLQDVSGTVQLVGPADLPVHVKREDALEIVGRVRQDQRAPRGFEVDIVDLRVLGEAAASLPFLPGSDLTDIGLETVLDYRPLALRTERGGTIFRVAAALVDGFRSALRSPRYSRTSARHAVHSWRSSMFICPRCCTCPSGRLTSALTVCSGRMGARTWPTTSRRRPNDSCVRWPSKQRALRRSLCWGSRCRVGRFTRLRATMATLRRGLTCCSAASKSLPGGSGSTAGRISNRRCVSVASIRRRLQRTYACSIWACHRMVAWPLERSG